MQATQPSTHQRILEQAVQAALDAGCKTIQDALGVQSGDFAGMYFSGDDTTGQIRAVFDEYLHREAENVIDDGIEAAEQGRVRTCVSESCGCVFFLVNGTLFHAPLLKSGNPSWEDAGEVETDNDEEMLRAEQDRARRELSLPL